MQIIPKCTIRFMSGAGVVDIFADLFEIPEKCGKNCNFFHDIGHNSSMAGNCLADTRIFSNLLRLFPIGHKRVKFSIPHLITCLSMLIVGGMWEGAFADGDGNGTGFHCPGRLNHPFHHTQQNCGAGEARLLQTRRRTTSPVGEWDTCSCESNSDLDRELRYCLGEHLLDLAQSEFRNQGCGRRDLSGPFTFEGREYFNLNTQSVFLNFLFDDATGYVFNQVNEHICRDDLNGVFTAGAGNRGETSDLCECRPGEVPNPTHGTCEACPDGQVRLENLLGDWPRCGPPSCPERTEYAIASSGVAVCEECAEFEEYNRPSGADARDGSCRPRVRSDCTPYEVFSESVNIRGGARTVVGGVCRPRTSDNCSINTEFDEAPSGEEGGTCIPCGDGEESNGRDDVCDCREGYARIDERTCTNSHHRACLDADLTRPIATSIFTDQRTSPMAGDCRPANDADAADLVICRGLSTLFSRVEGGACSRGQECASSQYNALVEVSNTDQDAGTCFSQSGCSTFLDGYPEVREDGNVCRLAANDEECSSIREVQMEMGLRGAQGVGPKYDPREEHHCRPLEQSDCENNETLTDGSCECDSGYERMEGNACVLATELHEACYRDDFRTPIAIRVFDASAGPGSEDCSAAETSDIGICGTIDPDGSGSLEAGIFADVLGGACAQAACASSTFFRLQPELAGHARRQVVGGCYDADACRDDFGGIPASGECRLPGENGECRQIDPSMPIFDGGAENNCRAATLIDCGVHEIVSNGACAECPANEIRGTAGSCESCPTNGVRALGATFCMCPAMGFVVIDRMCEAEVTCNEPHQERDASTNRCACVEGYVDRNPEPEELTCEEEVCPANQIRGSDDSCEPCPMNEVRPAGEGVCRCPAETHYSGDGPCVLRRAPNSCETNQFVNDMNSCQECPANEIRGSDGSCEACSPNEVREMGASSCSCPEATHYSGGGSCVLITDPSSCAPNEHVAENSCTECPENQVRGNDGSCEVCPHNEMRVAGATSCSCPDTHYSGGGSCVDFVTCLEGQVRQANNTCAANCGNNEEIQARVCECRNGFVRVGEACEEICPNTQIRVNGLGDCVDRVSCAGGTVSPANECQCPEDHDNEEGTCLERCESNESRQGQNCVCNAGFERNGESCVACREDQTSDMGGTCACESGRIDSGSMCVVLDEILADIGRQLANISELLNRITQILGGNPSRAELDGIIEEIDAAAGQTQNAEVQANLQLVRSEAVRQREELPAPVDMSSSSSGGGGSSGGAAAALVAVPVVLIGGYWLLGGFDYIDPTYNLTYQGENDNLTYQGNAGFELNHGDLRSYAQAIQSNGSQAYQSGISYGNELYNLNYGAYEGASEYAYDLNARLHYKQGPWTISPTADAEFHYANEEWTSESSAGLSAVWTAHRWVVKARSAFAGEVQHGLDLEIRF